MFPIKPSAFIFWAAIFSVAAIFLGFGMGAIFGAAEEKLKKNLDVSASVVFETVYKNDATAKDAVVKKSWDYFKRAHMHWGAIGSAGLGCIIILTLFCRACFSVNVSALLLGLGALIYPLFWLLAGIYAPSLGSTGAAKEMFKWIGLPGSVFCISGAAGTLFCLIRSQFLNFDQNLKRL